MEKPFRCSACGYEYYDSHNFSPCPVCSGLGQPDKDCTCSHFQNSLGVTINIIYERDPACPVHMESGKEINYQI